MTLPFITMAREHAESLAAAVREYNREAVKPERTGPTRRDLEKAARDAADQGENKDAVKAFKAYEKVLETLKSVRKDLQVVGADILGVDLESIGEEPTDEARDEARSNRKELVATLKMLAESSDAEASTWAQSFEIPNVGTDKFQTLGEGGTSRLRVWVDVTDSDGNTTRYESFSKLGLAAQSKKTWNGPKVDVDKIRSAYESASEDEQKAGVTGDLGDGWTVTVSPK